MDIQLEKANEEDAKVIFEMQVEAFTPLLEKYQDYETNPANETIDRVLEKITDPNRGFYKILAGDKLVGAISIKKKEKERYWISPMFILPKFQGFGFAQIVIQMVEAMFPEAKSWELATILEEKRNCYLYEKMGYVRTGEVKKINDHTTLIYYKKVV